MADTFYRTFRRLGRNGAGASRKRFGSGRGVALALGGAGVLALGVVGGSQLLAQIEGDRGIAPLANSEDIQVNNIKVDVTGKTGEDARQAGWKQAEQLAWKQIGGPAMPVESIDAMVSSVVIQQEQVGPHRYIATLGVIFDKAKAGQFVGSSGPVSRSAPMLVLPVLDSGGVRQVFEVRGAWQRAWAEFQTSQSPVDYVRPVGSGGESLILTAGQSGRRSRLWWRTVLDQFSAADVVIPVAHLTREWPGGPVHGTFTARFGPDDTSLGSFEMTALDDDALPAMLAQAVSRIDGIYRQALIDGRLRPDPTLMSSTLALDKAFAELKTKLMPGGSAAVGGDMTAPPIAITPSAPPVITPEVTISVPTATVSVQFPSPDAGAVDAALSAVRGVQGVQSATMSSLAMGGTSVMRVTAEGGEERIAAGLRARGWKVAGSGGILRISR
ncbi:heavy-metal-associated domain-containing protein [Novosphingobium sp. 9]|uniref:heavy-metal-associated domain-containing protein n=1 Tax=Novosphingobium sp. 9 TaxID=2025349 RepID=UPI0021B58704|nr:heavy-metal-associated domain-containing protein [Novosphingobium sp. 9]